MSVNKIQIFLIVIVIPFCALFFYAQSKGVTLHDLFFTNTLIMHIGEIPINVEVAKTDAEREKGLSGRPDLGKIDGLLFVFPTSDVHQMWMKDMNFPIDIIWIDKDLTVINIQKNIQPTTFPKTFKPLRPALYAVETKIEFSDVFGLREGLKVRLPVEYLAK